MLILMFSIKLNSVDQTNKNIMCPFQYKNGKKPTTLSFLTIFGKFIIFSPRTCKTEPKSLKTTTALSLSNKYSNACISP